MRIVNLLSELLVSSLIPRPVLLIQRMLSCCPDFVPSLSESGKMEGGREGETKEQKWDCRENIKKDVKICWKWKRPEPASSRDASYVHSAAHGTLRSS